MVNCFFGFGSLVNTATHRYTAVAPATVNGWSRIWINSDQYEHAFLSVQPDETTDIQGLMAEVPDNDWTELDRRELGYQRRKLNAGEWSLTPGSLDLVVSLNAANIQMYVAAGEPASPDKPILWSYLETVLLGYYRFFGEQGVHDFISSTESWTAILDDRKAPVYPRYVPATGAAGELIVSLLSAYQ